MGCLTAEVLLPADTTIDVATSQDMISAVEQEPELDLVVTVQDVAVNVYQEDTEVVLPQTDKVVDILVSGPGTAASGSTSPAVFTLQAGEDLGANRVVYANGGQALYADRRQVTHLGRVVGLTTHSATAGQDIEVQAFDDMTLVSWSWVPGSLWLGIEGRMTQTRPTDGFLLRVARALSPTVIAIDIDDGIILI